MASQAIGEGGLPPHDVSATIKPDPSNIVSIGSVWCYTRMRNGCFV